MATQYTNLLGFALPQTGELSGTWGTVVNQNITELVEDAIAATATASVTSGNWTLSTTGSGAANEARCAILIPTGTPGTTRNIIAPSQSKAYVVINKSDGSVVVKGAATTGATVPAGNQAVVAWDGSDFVLATGLGDVTTTGTQTLTNKTLNSAILNDGYTEEVFAISDGSTVNLDPNNGSIQTWTLGANRTPGQANWAAGQSITLMVNDGSAYNITWTTLNVSWKTDGGIAPTLNTTGFTAIQLWKVGTTIYGARVGDA